MVDNMTLFDLLYAARTVWGEARGETQAGKVAVAWVIRNRFESEKWFAGATIKDTVLKPYQFSCWNENDPNRVEVLNVEFDNKDLQKCLYAVLGVFTNLEPDPTYGSTHYHADGVSPDWADGKVPVCSIGGHRFFNDID